MFPPERCVTRAFARSGPRKHPCDGTLRRASEFAAEGTSAVMADVEAARFPSPDAPAYTSG
jgi:hypothetical protein